jgi:hypothetical protein
MTKIHNSIIINNMLPLQGIIPQRRGCVKSPFHTDCHCGLDPQSPDKQQLIFRGIGSKGTLFQNAVSFAFTLVGAIPCGRPKI